MKKVVTLLFSLAFLSLFNINSFAEVVEPTYDETFDNGAGIFAANGNDIVISEVDGETVISWDGGSQVIKDTTYVIGGSIGESTVPESNITVEGGTIGAIYGGGYSNEADKIAVVNKSNVVVNGGEIVRTLYGGGLLYTTVNEANIEINGGTINAICGGGASSATISGVTYNAGEETDLENAKNRVIKTNVVINDGEIISLPSNYGSLFGGGQGYSYVGDSTMTINGGNLYAYVVAGGSNGLTKNSTVTINGGEIYSFQTVNRGEMDNSKVRIFGGSIKNAYIAGDSTDPTVTGEIDNVDFAVLTGKVESLNAGVSASTPIDIDQEKYKSTYVQGTVENDLTGISSNMITYSIDILEDSIMLYKGNQKNLKAKITTSPAGNENLFEDASIRWSVIDDEIANIDTEGNVKGLKLGSTSVMAEFLDEYDTSTVQVTESYSTALVILSFELLALILLALRLNFR